MPKLETVEEIIEWLNQKVTKDRDKLSVHGTSIKLNISGSQGGVWTIFLRQEKIGVEKGDFDSDCTITTSDRDFIELFNKRLKPEIAIITGRIRLSGNIALVTRLAELLKN